MISYEGIPAYFFCVSANVVYSQPKVALIDMRYFNNKLEPVDATDGPAYFELDSTWDDNTSSAYSFYVTSNKRRYIERRGSNAIARQRTWYYESGRVQMRGLFKYNEPIGMQTILYEDAKPMAQVLFPAEQGNFKILQYWDTLGNQLIADGNGKGNITFTSLQYFIPGGAGMVVSGLKHGLWTGRDGSGIYQETYENGELMDGTMPRDGIPFTYTKINVRPEFVDGLSGMSIFLSKNIEYPARARRLGREGTVFIGFMVESDGTISGAKVLKSVSKDLDAEALRVVKKMPKWNPGAHRGKSARVRFVLPVKFVLE